MSSLTSTHPGRPLPSVAVGGATKATKATKPPPMIAICDRHNRKMPLVASVASVASPIGRNRPVGPLTGNEQEASVSNRWISIKENRTRGKLTERK
jgi:hypothetical protein